MPDQEKKEDQAQVENKEETEVKEPEVKIVASDAETQKRLEALESQLEYFKKERMQLINRNNNLATEN